MGAHMSPSGGFLAPFPRGRGKGDGGGSAVAERAEGAKRRKGGEAPG